MNPKNRKMLLFSRQIISLKKNHKAQLPISDAGSNDTCGGKGV